MDYKPMSSQLSCLISYNGLKVIEMVNQYILKKNTK